MPSSQARAVGTVPDLKDATELQHLLEDHIARTH